MDDPQETIRKWLDWIQSEIAEREREQPNQLVSEYNKHVVYGLKLSLAAMLDVIKRSR